MDSHGPQMEGIGNLAGPMEGVGFGGMEGSGFGGEMGGMPMGGMGGMGGMEGMGEMGTQPQAQPGEEEELDPEERERLAQIRIDQDNRLRALGMKEQQELEEKREK